MEYVYYIIALFVGSGLGFCTAAIFAAGGRTDLETTIRIQENALRSKEKELDDLSIQFGWLEQSIEESACDCSKSLMKQARDLHEKQFNNLSKGE